MKTKTDVYENDRELLRALQGVFERAVENNTIEDIKPFIHADFSFVSFTDKSFNDFDSFKKQWDITRKEMIGSGSFITRLNPDATQFIGDIAVSTGLADNKLVDNKGNNFEFSNHWTVVFRRVEGEWMILRAHNSLDPFSNPMLVSGVKNKIMKYSALFFLAGIIISSILTYLF